MSTHTRQPLTHRLSMVLLDQLALGHCSGLILLLQLACLMRRHTEGAQNGCLCLSVTFSHISLYDSHANQCIPCMLLRTGQRELR